MRAAALVLLVVMGCADLLDIPDRHLDPDHLCSGTIEIKILYDSTGLTSDVGLSFFKGQQDLIHEINEARGIRGCTIGYEACDLGYVPARCDLGQMHETVQDIYEAWKADASWPGIAAILGGGSSDSLLLAPRVREDQKLLLSASYLGSLAAPEPVMHDEHIPELSERFEELSFPQSFTSGGYPYNFFAGTDDSTGARIAMFQVRALGGKRVGFFACSLDDCQGPLPAARKYARQQGLLLGRDLAIELTDNESTIDSKVRRYFMEEKAQMMADPTYQMVDWVWSGNLTTTTAYIAKAIEKYGGVQLIVNNRGFDESLLSLCEQACVERVHGIMPFVAYGDPRAAEMSEVMALHDKRRIIDAMRDGKLASYRNVHYVQGYVNVAVFRRAAEAVIVQGKPVTGINLKEALESFRAVDTGGLTGLLSFSPTDHRPQSTESIYKLGANGELVLEAQRTITMQEDWLGW